MSGLPFTARTYARISCLVLTLAGSTACSATTSTLDLESARTAAQVITAFVNDPEIGVRPIDVRVTGSVVRLVGRVRTEREMMRAIELARTVPGVTRVDSSLTIGADRQPDRDPRSERRTLRDPAVEFAELEPSQGRLALGVSFGSGHPRAGVFNPAWSVGPLVRFGSSAGLGPAIGFDWYQTTLTASEPSLPSSRLRVRPVMFGLAYTVIAGPFSMSPSLVAGYALNRVSVPESGTARRLVVDVRNSLAWRPGVSIWINTGRRTIANVSVGQVRTRLPVTFVEDGLLQRRSLNGHSTMVSVGLAYKLF